jgi:hypothetical protein
MRTTLNIDTPILDEVKRIHRKEGGSLGQVVTRLLAEALARHNGPSDASPPLEWISKPMGSRVDLSDREAVYAILDDDGPPASP